MSSSDSSARPAVWVRRPGSRAVRAPIQFDTAGSMFGFTPLAGGIGSLTWRRRIAIGVFGVGNGTSPASSS